MVVLVLSLLTRFPMPLIQTELPLMRMVAVSYTHLDVYKRQVQGCEHLNRALVVERELALAKDLEIVNVLPTLHAEMCIRDRS